PFSTVGQSIRHPKWFGEPSGSPAGTLRFTKRGVDAAPGNGTHNVSTTYTRGRQHERSGRRVAFLSCVNRERQGGPKEATMKRTTTYVATAAAALIITAGTASAQSLMKAEVPFAFNVGNKVVEPGTYRIGIVSPMTSNVVLRVDNVDTKSTHMMLPQAS